MNSSYGVFLLTLAYKVILHFLHTAQWSFEGYFPVWFWKCTWFCTEMGSRRVTKAESFEWFQSMFLSPFSSLNLKKVLWLLVPFRCVLAFHIDFSMFGHCLTVKNSAVQIWTFNSFYSVCLTSAIFPHSSLLMVWNWALYFLNIDSCVCGIFQIMVNYQDY